MRWALPLMVLLGCGRTEPYRAAHPLLPPESFDAGTDGGSRDGGIDGGVDGGPINPAVCESGPPNFLMGLPCSASVRVLSITKSMASCFVDVTAAAGETGLLVWDCRTDGGRAEIQFAKGTFVGRTAPPFISVCTGTSFPWSDGCFWRSAQRIEGQVVPNGSLTFSYVERPDETHCAPPCSATGDVRIQ